MDKKRNYQLNKLPLGASGTSIPMVLNRIKQVSSHYLFANSTFFHSEMKGILSGSAICLDALHSPFKGLYKSLYSPSINQNDVCCFPTTSVRKTETKFQVSEKRQGISLSSQIKTLSGMLDLSVLRKLVVDHLAIASAYMWNQSGINDGKVHHAGR